MSYSEKMENSDVDPRRAPDYIQGMSERSETAHCKATPEMIAAAVDAYFGQNERQWEDDLEGCIREIVEAALAAQSTVSVPPLEG